jgi:hypothetical protein
MRFKRDWPRYAMVLDMHLAGQSYKAIACQVGIPKQRVQQMIRLAKHTLARRVFKGLPKYLYQWDQDRGCYVAEN